ncbi:hypothetical protein JCM15519_28400 [Fundidesulfovibrio butyratiphilus]
MKILPDQTTPVTQVTQTRQVASSQSASTQNFAEILAQEVSSSQATSQTTQSAPSAGVAGLAQAMAVQAATSVSETSSTDQAVMDTVDNMLGQWENYAGQLAAGGQTNLRQAYGTLESIQSGVEKLKSDNPDLAEQNTQLSSLVNELDVLATTEKIKFNRGDYL